MKIVSMALMVLGIEVHGSGGVVGADDDDTMIAKRIMTTIKFG